MAEENYESIFNGMIDTAWIISFEGDILDVNSTALEMLGYTKDEIIEIGLTGLDSTHSAEEIKFYVNNMPRDKFQIIESTHKKKNGDSFPVEIYSNVITYHGNEVILSVARDISKRKWAENEIKKQLTEKENLLKATHHRMKNHIASIASLLSLQLKSTENQEAYSIIQDTIGRVNCMQVLYNNLLIANDYENISVKTYCKNIIDSILNIYSCNTVEINIDIDEFTIDRAQIFPLGVIIEELLTNILKYAFPEQKNCLIDFSLKNLDKEIKLVIHDNGVGFPKEMEKDDKYSGFGLMIVKILSRQLQAKFSIQNDTGTKCTLLFEPITT